MTTARAGAAPLAARYLPHALAGYVLETRLTGQTDGTAAATISSPWDLWWACFRTAIVAWGMQLTTCSSDQFDDDGPMRGLFNAIDSLLLEAFDRAFRQGWNEALNLMRDDTLKSSSKRAGA